MKAADVAVKPDSAEPDPSAFALRRAGSIYQEVLSALGAKAWAPDPAAPSWYWPDAAVREPTDAEQAAYEARAGDPEFAWLYGHWGEVICGAAPEPDPEPAELRLAGPLYRDEGPERARATARNSHGPLSGFEPPADDEPPTMPPQTLSFGALDDKATRALERFDAAHDAIGEGDDRPHYDRGDGVSGDDR